MQAMYCIVWVLLLLTGMLYLLCLRTVSVPGQVRIWVGNPQLKLGPGLSSWIRCWHRATPPTALSSLPQSVRADQGRV